MIQLIILHELEVSSETKLFYKHVEFGLGTKIDKKLT